MHQFFSRPDFYIRRAGHLDAVVTECAIQDAPPFMRGLRVLFVADVHTLRTTTQQDIDSLTERMVAASPDLLLLGGDYSDWSTEARRLFDSWKALRPPLGCYGVMGNNDAEAWESPRELRRALAKAGCRLLVNQSERLKVRGGALYIAGVDEHRFGYPDSRGLYPANPAPDVYRVLLSHYPCAPERVPDLMLSGHTHGGQFNLLGLTPFSIGFERLSSHPVPSMAVAGLHDIGGMKLMISKGIGASRLQLRIGVRPEINLLTFG